MHIHMCKTEGHSKTDCWQEIWRERRDRDSQREETE